MLLRHRVALSPPAGVGTANFTCSIDAAPWKTSCPQIQRHRRGRRRRRRDDCVRARQARLSRARAGILLLIGRAAASYGNAGTLGVNAKTQPPAKACQLIRDTLIHDDPRSTRSTAQQVDPARGRPRPVLLALGALRRARQLLVLRHARRKLAKDECGGAGGGLRRGERRDYARSRCANRRPAVGDGGRRRRGGPAAVAEPALHAIAPRITAAKSTSDDAQARARPSRLGWRARAPSVTASSSRRTGRCARSCRRPTAAASRRAHGRRRGAARRRCRCLRRRGDGAAATAGGFAPIMPLLGTAHRRAAGGARSHLAHCRAVLPLHDPARRLAPLRAGVLAPATPSTPPAACGFGIDASRWTIGWRRSSSMWCPTWRPLRLGGRRRVRGARPLTPDAQPIVGATNRRALYVSNDRLLQRLAESALSTEVLAAVAGAPPPADVDVSGGACGDSSRPD